MNALKQWLTARGCDLESGRTDQVSFTRAPRNPRRAPAAAAARA
jgi:hypothetical protein